MHEALVSLILWGAVAPQSTFTSIHHWHADAPQRCSVQLQQVPGTLSPMQKADAPHLYTPQYRLLLVQSLKTGFPRLTNCIFTSKPIFFTTQSWFPVCITPTRKRALGHIFLASGIHGTNGCGAGHVLRLARVRAPTAFGVIWGAAGQFAPPKSKTLRGRGSKVNKEAC